MNENQEHANTKDTKIKEVLAELHTLTKLPRDLEETLNNLESLSADIGEGEHLIKEIQGNIQYAIDKVINRSLFFDKNETEIVDHLKQALTLVVNTVREHQYAILKENLKNERLTHTTSGRR